MSKILVVEPYKILQRAIAVTFFPEHEVQIVDEFPATGALEQGSYDIFIIDAGALRERHKLGDLYRRVQDWCIPTIWLEETVSTVTLARDKLVVLRKPIAKTALLEAVAQSQRNESAIALATGTEDGETAGDKEGSSIAQLAAHSEQKAPIIDLVDVVEEGATRTRDRQLERNKK